MSSAETAPFGAVFVSRGASCSRRGRVSAAFSVRRVFILRSRFSVLDDELGRVGLPLSASISGPGRTWPRPVGRGSCGGARGIHSRPVVRRPSIAARGPRCVCPGTCSSSASLPRYSLELADPWAVARGSRAVVRGLRAFELGPWAVARGPSLTIADERRQLAAPKNAALHKGKGFCPISHSQYAVKHFWFHVEHDPRPPPVEKQARVDQLVNSCKNFAHMKSNWTP
jgi:hypothetical protein